MSQYQHNFQEPESQKTASSALKLSRFSIDCVERQKTAPHGRNSKKMKLNGVSIFLVAVVSAMTTVADGNPKGSMMYGINPLDMVFGAMGDDMIPMDTNEPKPIRGIQRIFSPQGNPEGFQQSPQQLQMSPNNNLFIMSNNERSNQGENEIESGDMMNNLQPRNNDAVEIPSKSTPEPVMSGSSFEFAPKFEISRQPEGLLVRQNPFGNAVMNVGNPTQQKPTGDEVVKPEQTIQRKLNIELDFQVEMPKPNEDKTSKSPTDRDGDIAIPVTTTIPNVAPEPPKDGRAALSLLDLLLPSKASRKPTEQAVSSRCDSVTCVPPPKESTCHLQKASIEIKGGEAVDSKFAELSDCCPLWLCTRPDGSFHTHYGEFSAVLTIVHSF